MNCRRDMLWDSRLQSLPGWLFKHFHNIKCLKNPHGEIPPVKEISRQFGIRPCRVRNILHLLIAYGVLETRPDGHFAERKYQNVEGTPMDIFLMRLLKKAEKLENKNPRNKSNLDKEFENWGI